MNKAQMSRMSMAELVAYYNKHSKKQITRFSDRKTAERRCAELNTRAKSVVETASRPEMVTSLKLDRRITCLDNGKTWANAYQMWVENPKWMTSSQQDRLTAQLYAAAKRGVRLTLKINQRQFRLVSAKLRKA